MQDRRFKTGRTRYSRIRMQRISIAAQAIKQRLIAPRRQFNRYVRRPLRRDATSGPVYRAGRRIRRPLVQMPFG